MKYFMTIAGSDNSGGAGIQQDLKVAEKHNFWGISAITGITVQNFEGLDAIYPLSVAQVSQQIRKNFESFPIDVVKIGALCSVEIAKELGNLLAEFKPKFVILDPVFAPTKGEAFISDDDAEIFRSLLKYVDVVTPNKREIELLAGRKPNSLIEAIEQAKEISSKYKCSVYLKGGHFSEDKQEIMEVLVIKSDIFYYTKQREKLSYSHGTGCFFASALGCLLAEGFNIKKSCEKATLEVSEFYKKIDFSD